MGTLTTQRAPIALAMVLAATALTSCSSTDVDVTYAALASANQSDLATLAATLPFESLHAADEVALQNQAVFHAAKKCLAHAGDPTAELSADAFLHRPSLANAERYLGILDSEAAAVHGYRSPSSQDRSPTEGTVDCWSTAAERVFGKLAGAPESANGLLAAEEELRAAVFDSPVADKATSKWRVCMRSAGIHAESPQSIRINDEIFSVTEITESGPVTTHEKSVATTDVACKKSSGYGHMLLTELRAQQEKWLTEHPEIVHAERTNHEQMTAAARDYLANQ